MKASIVGKEGLREHLNILSKRKKIIFLVFFIIFGVMAVSSFIATPIYEGSAKIIIERVESNNLSGVAARQRLDPEFDQTQFQLMYSQAVARRVVNSLELAEESSPIAKLNKPSMFSKLINSVKSWISSNLHLLMIGGETVSSDTMENEDPDHWSKEDLIALQITKQLNVTPVKNSHITRVSFTSPDPGFSANAANAFVQAYLEETLDMKMEATRRNLGWMTAKAEAERMKLQEAERRLQAYMKDQDLVTMEDRVTILPEKLSQLGLALMRAETKTKEYRLLYNKVKRASGDLDEAEVILSIAEGNTLDVVRAQILKAEQSVMELSGKYGTKHPTMLKAKRDLEVLKNKRKQEIERITQKVRGQYELALSNEKSIREQLNETKAEALVLNEKYGQYSVIKREIDTNRQLYDALLTKIKDQSIMGETRPVNLWVVESAKVPKDPIKPIIALNLLLGAIYGLVIGVACAFFYDHMDNRVKSADGIRDKIDVPVLGSVIFNKNLEIMHEIVLTEPRSEYAENFNTLRTTLLLSSAGDPPRKILVTSSIPGEGKTTTSINLALTMAKSDSRVVLIDMDLRKPKIHHVFKIKNTIGLSSYLSGGADKSVLKKTSHDNLVILPAGPMPPNPYELLNSRRMKLLLQSLEQEFDVIICDSPPILSVADSREVSQNFDGLIMVARAGLTTFPMLQNSLNLLGDVNAKVLGVLVNAVKPVDQEYYQYYSSYIENASKRVVIM